MRGALALTQRQREAELAAQMTRSQRLEEGAAQQRVAAQLPPQYQ